MLGYEIKDLSKKTQQLIREKNIDVNQDSKINEENLEMAELLSQTGKSDINELVYDTWWERKKDELPGIGILSGIAATLGIFASNIPDEIDMQQIEYNAKREFSILKSDADFYKRLTGKTKPLPSYDELYENCLKNAKKGLRQGKTFKAVIGSLGVTALATALYLLFRKEEKIYPVEDKNLTYGPSEPSNGWEAKYKEGFALLGILDDIELKEYIPQKGEYWISILKAKYGVDDAVASKMAKKIKEMIYDDPTAAKQATIMYLPQTWNFEGVEYTYLEDAKPEKTEVFSENVKTEMGKMDKDLEY